jgi:hypothetical protein
VQTGLAFAADGSASPVAEPVTRSLRRVRRNYRADALISMLAEKGPLPAEILHKAIRQGWRYLQRELGCSKLEAFKLWVSLIESLLPYTAARLAQLEIKTDPGAAAHFLAASAFASLAPPVMLPNHEFGNDNRARGQVTLLSSPSRARCGACGAILPRGCFDRHAHSRLARTGALRCHRAPVRSAPA